VAAFAAQPARASKRPQETRVALDLRDMGAFRSGFREHGEVVSTTRA
jgi:hypothetical protein